MKKSLGLLVTLSLGILGQASAADFLTEPMLQSPTERTVTVVWFTEEQGMVQSYVYNLLKPDEAPQLFDEFAIGE